MEKEKQEEKTAGEAAAAAPMEVPIETQEQYREQGRQEMEAKCSKRLRELEKLVTSSHQEAETLREEITSIKDAAANREKMAKRVLLNAREKIMMLIQDKTSLTQQLNGVAPRMMAVQNNTGEDVARMTALKTKYESQIAHLEKEIANLRAEKLCEIEASDACLVQHQGHPYKLRHGKIAKKYQTQSEKQEQEEKAAAAAAPIIVPPEIQEQYREEGRREMESKNSERLRELVEEVMIFQQEAKNLHNENTDFRSAAMELMSQVRQMFHQLQMSKTSLTQQLAEVTNRMKAVEQNRDEGDAHLAALKSDYEIQIAHLEMKIATLRAEKLHEMEALGARLVQLLGQVD